MRLRTSSLLTRLTAVLSLSIGLCVASAADAPYRIAFASFAPLDTDIFIAGPDGADAKPFLPHPDLDSNASFSGDGRWVIFSSRRAGSTDIYRAHPDGTGLERLVDHPSYDDQAALSPDGKLLAFVSDREGQADVWILDITTRDLRNLTRHAGGDFRPAWSPDGKSLAFSSDRDSPRPRWPPNNFFPRQTARVFVIGVDGTGLRSLTDGVVFAGSPAFSADGARVAFYTASLEALTAISGVRALQGTTQIEVVDLATGKRSALSAGDGEKWTPRWLHDSRVGFVSRPPAGGIEFIAGAAGARGDFRHASWSRDGKRLVFHREVDPIWPPHRAWHSLDPRFELIRTGIFPSFTPGGERMISNDKTAGMHQNAILLMNADGSSRRVLYAHPDKAALAPVLSPDGTTIAFGLGKFFPAILGPSVADIAIMPITGGEPRVLTDGHSNHGFPSFSPDGRQIVYREVGRETNALRIMDIASGAHRVLIEGKAHYNFPAWSPKDDVIAFTGDQDGDYEIYTVRSDGTALTRLTHSPGNEGHHSWSHDGRWIAFSSARGGYRDEVALYIANPQAYGDIYVMRADGSEQVQLSDDQFEEATPGWMPR